MDRSTELMNKAKDATGLADFGDDSFRVGLERLVSSLDNEAQLNALGRGALDAQIVDFLSQRLDVEDWYRRHPEIDEQEIVAPVIGLGLPRTGSTALSNMLAEDPAVRSIRAWETINPCPPPETATEANDPRIAKSQARMDFRNKTFPRMKTMVPSTATGPTECQTFMGLDFKSHLFQAQAQIPSYSEWLHHDADLVPTYAYVKRVLKLLQWKCPPHRWRLKNPSHIVFIDALAQVFPDARYWMTHRDVANVIPSSADLYSEMISAFSETTDRKYLGELNASTWELGMQRLIAFRDKRPDVQFFDIHFAPFQKDPYPILEQLYAFLGETLTPEAVARMKAWRDSTPREKHGAHEYDMADFGLSRESLRERFRFYSDRFGVAAA